MDLAVRRKDRHVRCRRIVRIFDQIPRKQESWKWIEEEYELGSSNYRLAWAEREEAELPYKQTVQHAFGDVSNRLGAPPTLTASHTVTIDSSPFTNTSRSFAPSKGRAFRVLQVFSVAGVQR